MANLNSIPGIGKSSQELLEVAGFLEVEDLAKAGVDELVAELEKANSILKIAKRTPVRSTVEKWVETAREVTGFPSEDDSSAEPMQMPVNYEGSEEVSEMLAGSPCAIPLPPKVMMENRLSVPDIPAGILLNRYSGDLEVRISSRAQEAAGNPPEAVPAVRRDQGVARDKLPSTAKSNGSPLVQRAEYESRLEIDTSRVKTFEEFSEAAASPRKAQPNGRSSPEGNNDRVALLRAPREETNRGRDPKSRWYIKGVLHATPFSLAFGAIITLLLMLVLPAALVSATLLFISDQFPGTLPWVPKWILGFPLALPVLGFLYLAFGLGGKCRICGQRLFWPRHCRKNSKAHHVPVIGHIVPTALHMLTFKWFRCIYCGTPVRLKK
jgi:hypothetical protein